MDGKYFAHMSRQIVAQEERQVQSLQRIATEQASGSVRELVDRIEKVSTHAQRLQGNNTELEEAAYQQRSHAQVVNDQLRLQVA